MIVSTKKLLNQANNRNFAIPAFNVNNLEMLQGVVFGAVSKKSPIIIQTSEGAIAYAGMDMLGTMVHEIASKCNIDIAFHLDHGKDIDLVVTAIKSGWYSSVMFDGSSLSYKENMSKTKKVVALAHRYRIAVEAELGAIPGKEDVVSVSKKQAMFTDPKCAQDFVAKTGCDFLAIAIGTAHGAVKFEHSSHLDFKRLTDIKSRINIPLVLHGASGIPKTLKEKYNKHINILHDEDRLSHAKGVSDTHIQQAIKLGIDKINIDSDLRIAFLVGIRDELINDKKTIDPRELLSPARHLISQVVAEKIQLCQSAKYRR